MQGPFDQQTENIGFYMPLLGATPRTQFATVSLGRVLAFAPTHLDRS
jgi:hypothetical protein